MSAGEERFEAPFDLDRLTDCEREVWEKYCSGPPTENYGPTLRVWSFGYICMLECEGVPEVVDEYLERKDPHNTIGEYLENVREAGREREREAGDG